MEKKLFGVLPSGEEIFLYTLKSGKATVKIMTRGATIVHFNAFGREIVGGFDSLDDYLRDGSHQGATIGRVANRIGGAEFVMDGKTYRLPKNDGENCLHGGDGFDHKVWTVEEYADDRITLSYLSADGEEGFPSALLSKVTFTLSGAALIIHYEATPEGKTPIALTNHSYFNLNGFGGSIESHTAQIYAERYTEVGEDLIPNGNHPEVKGTAFDFTEPHKIGERVGGGFLGYDHNFVLSPTEEKAFGEYTLGHAARVCGRDLSLDVYTDQPGVQFYIGNFLGGEPDFRGGVKKIFHGAFCLETQTEPDCVSHGVGFYDKGETYTHTTVYEVGKVLPPRRPKRKAKHSEKPQAVNTAAAEQEGENA